MATTLQNFSRLQEISDNEWSVILKHLILYAELRLTRIGFSPRSEIDSVTGEDFAMEAIKKLFEGKRDWDFNKHPDLLIHLKLVVKSLVWNHIKSSAKAIVRQQELTFIESVSDPDQTSEPDEIVTANEINELADNQNPQEIVITQERWCQIETAFGEDIDGFIIFCDWLDEIPPRMIAEKYGIVVKIVNNIIKKGKRIITKVYVH